jgi:ATP-dependent helicase/nuclease subunit A
MIPAPYPSGDDGARRRIAESLDESLIVEASAGTGKTTELVRRIVAVLERGTKIQGIAAMTFTHKAAGELKLRLRHELDRARTRSPHIEEALKHLEEASIGTIHSFCAQILRERPVEARVDPAFEELNEQSSWRLYDHAFETWLERRLRDDSPGLRRAFARLTWRDSWDDSPPLERLKYTGWQLIEWRDFRAAWKREPFAREEEIDTIVRKVRDLAERSEHPRNVNDYLYTGLMFARALAGKIDRIEKAAPRDYDALEGLLLKLGRDLRHNATRTGRGTYSNHIAREELVAMRNDVQRWIEDFRGRAGADLASLLRSEMAGLVDEYEDRKRRMGKLDFVDLLQSVRDLIRDDAGVRRYLQTRYTHLFVDEFQDTDGIQAEILLLLAADDPAEADWRNVRPAAGKLFLVGDPKQSIYKFRRADMVLYRQIRERLETRGVGLVKLTRSFRAVRNIQKFVNAAFELQMDGDAESAQAEWADLEEHRTDHAAQPSVVVLPVPRPYGKRQPAKSKLVESLPDAIAAYVAWLLRESNWKIADAESGEARPVQPQDIALLFRKRNYGKIDLTRECVRALEARGIPHLLAASRSFHKREEVETVRTALTAIEWPDDELSIFATLKGSLFAIEDQILLRYHATHGRFHPFHLPEQCDPELRDVVDALQVLATLHRERNRRPLADTVNALLEATRAHAGFFLRPGGHQVLANAARVAQLARNFEISGGISFRGFIAELEKQADREEAAEAPLLEEDANGVRLLTVHSAKGLEFPVVILADPNTAISRDEGEQYVDASKDLCASRLLGCAPRELAENDARESARQRAEGVRVAYVAATRARDLLVIPAVGDGPFPGDGWLEPLNKAIYPSKQDWRKAVAAEGCPPFGVASVLERPHDMQYEEEVSVRPGKIFPERGDHDVVWWDPSKLTLRVKGRLSLDQEKILGGDEGVSLAAYRAWEKNREAALAAGSEPQFRVVTASQATEIAPGPFAGFAVAVETVESKGTRPGGKRFGTLVHAVLRDVELDASPAAIAALVDLNARSTGASPAEVDAAKGAVAGALQHPLLVRARKAERCYREYPVTLPVDGGKLIEGIIDLAFVENGEWQIVDFKTDADLEAKRSDYERQLHWYAYALTKLTGMPARATLLGV